MLSNEDKVIMESLMSRNKISDVLVFLYWYLVEMKDKMHIMTSRRTSIINIANKVDDAMEFARKIGE